MLKHLKSLKGNAFKIFAPAILAGITLSVGLGIYLHQEVQRLEQRTDALIADIVEQNAINNFYAGGEIDHSKEIKQDFLPSQRFKPFVQFTIDDLVTLEQSFSYELPTYDQIIKKENCDEACLGNLLAQILPYIDPEVPTELNTPSIAYGEKKEWGDADYFVLQNQIIVRAEFFNYETIAHEGFHAQHISDETLAEVLALEALANMALDGNNNARTALFAELFLDCYEILSFAKQSSSESNLYLELERSEAILRQPGLLTAKETEGLDRFIKYEKDPFILAVKAMNGEQVMYKGFVLDGLYRLGEEVERNFAVESQKR